MPLLAMSAVSLGMLSWKAPHLNLLGRIMAGDFETDVAPVTEMPAPTRHEMTASVQLGSLGLEVPQTLRWRVVRFGDNCRMRIEGDRFYCLLFKPTHDLLPDARALAGPLQSHLPSGEVAVRAAAYRASAHDLSFWMGVADVQRLEALLETKPCCIRAERVELLSADHVRGFLAFRHGEAKTRIIFDYFSRDERQCGRAIFVVPRGDESAIDRVRAIAASFHIAQD